MPNLTGQERALCPFYQEDSAGHIICEGLTEYNRQILHFPDPADKEEWFDFVCTQPEYDRLCPYAVALHEIYRLGTMGAFCRHVRSAMIKETAIKNRATW